jgi:signal transduction histidine kinase
MPHIANSDHNKGSNLDRMADMTLEERSAAEQRARATEKLAAIGEMAGGIAHDFRNLLAAIGSGLGLAERSCEQPEKVRTYIAAARDAIDRGVKLTAQLLAFAKLQELEARAGDVNELLESLRLLLKYSAGPGVRIKFEFGSAIPKCLVDPSQFGAAVLNLVVNARDAMPNGGVVEISTDRWQVRAPTSASPAPGTYVRVRVKDSGHGMSARVVRRVFDPFYTTKGDKGTGLGLPQVRAFMRLIGGYVSVSSEWGCGTTVDLLFPSPDPGAAVSLPAQSQSGHEPVLRSSQSLKGQSQA